MMENLQKNTLIEANAEYIEENKSNKYFLSTLLHYLEKDRYDKKSKRWIKVKNKDEDKIIIDKKSAAMFVSIHALTLLCILNIISRENEDSLEEITFERNEGTYRLKKVDNTWLLGFTLSN
jgi:hypothetical protein